MSLRDIPPAAAERRLRNLAPAAVWVGLLALLGFLALVTGLLLREAAGWADWGIMALLWALLALGLRAGLAVPCTWLTLRPDGSVHLVSRTPFARRAEVLAPGSLGHIEVMRNHFGPILGYQIRLHLRDGRRLMVSERVDGARQQALAAEIARRLGPADG